MFRTFSLPVTWKELLSRTVKEFSADNCLGLSAQLAYYLLLALVPALVFLVALTSYFPAALIAQLMTSLQSVAPAEISGLIAEQLRNLTESEDSGILTVGFLMALWSSSAATVSIVDALNRAYDIEEARPWWKARLTAIALTILLAVTLMASIALVLGGPAAADWLATRTGWGAPFEWSWKILQWPLVVALVALGLGLLNYFGPDAEQDWEWITPGALLSALLWLLTSLAFKLYVANFGNYNDTYGSLGAVIVLMLWLYLSGLAILIGAEMNAEIEHASPHGKAPGQKVPGQRKRLGARAARAFAARPAPVVKPHPAPSTAARSASLADRGASLDWLTIAAQAGVAIWAYRRAAKSDSRT